MFVLNQKRVKVVLIDATISYLYVKDVEIDGIPNVTNIATIKIERQAIKICFIIAN